MGRCDQGQPGKKITRRQLEAHYHRADVVIAGVKPVYVFFMDESAINRSLPLVLPVDIFSNRVINGAVSIVVTFFIPFVLLNYLLLFVNNNYESVLKKYRGKQGRFYKRYALISLGILAIPVIIVALYFKEV